MKKKGILGAAIVVVILVVAFGLSSVLGNTSSKIEKTIKDAPTFYIFGYSNKTEPIALNQDYTDSEVTWNPEKVAIIFDTEKVEFTAIYDGLDNKLAFVEEKGQDGLIVSHFVKADGIVVKEGSALEAYLADNKITKDDFQAYADKLYTDNDLKAKYDAYKLKFATHAMQ